MASPRWRKVVADLRLSRSRTLLVVLSIAIGIFAVGSVLTTRDALFRGIDDSVDAANPASAVLLTGSFDEQLVEDVRALPAIGDAEGRTSLEVRLQDGDGGSPQTLELLAIADFEDIRIDRVMPDDGAWPPATGEVLIERASLGDAGVAIGDEVTIETPEGARHTLRVGGVAYDPGKVAPGLGDGTLSGFISRETLAALGQPEAFNELLVVAADDPREVSSGERVAGLARDEVFEPSEVTVHRIAVHDTPRYHSPDLGNALMLILGVMGGLVLLLGVFLVVTTVSALLAQQVRQIGVMKAIGARRRQIVALYLGLVLAYGLLAVLIAAPLAALAGWASARLMSGMLNIELRGPWFPLPVVALELALGLLVPLLVALVPVMRGTRITVREALTSYGIGDRASRSGVLDRLRGVPRPVLLSLRNTFRRRGRLALTLMTLTLGGAIFASVATVQASLDQTLVEVLQYGEYDVELSLREPEPVAGAVSAIETVPGAERAEGWIASNASRLRPDGTQNSNIWLTAAPAATDLVQPTLVEGRWFEPGEGEAFVVNIDFQQDEPDIDLGDTVTLSVEGQKVRWPVIGIVSSQLMGPVVYAPYETLSETLGIPGEANRIVVVTERHDASAQTETAQAIEQRVRADGLPVTDVQTASDMRQGTQGAFDIVVMLLAAIGVLLVAVGSMGLMGAMALNVIERTREIGVMRAIGASNGAVARIVIVEGLVIGLLAWLLGAVLALPLSWGLSNMIGVAFLQVPLAYSFSAAGVVIWLMLVIVLSVVASVLPARNAWRLSVREVLAYE